MNCNLTGKIECFTNTWDLEILAIQLLCEDVRGVQCTVTDTHCYFNGFFHPIPKKESVSHLESESVRIT